MNNQVLTKTMAEEKTRQQERLRELHREEERIAAERDRFHERTSQLEHEKQRLEKLALSVKRRSSELDNVTEVFTYIDYSHGTSAHAQKGRGLLEEVLKMLNCRTVCQFGSIFHTKSDTF